MPVRWALEEVGRSYDVRLVSFSEMKEPAHPALQLFRQIPTYEEGNLALFESGAILFHVAERHTGLLPNDANARVRAIAWMFAALSTVKPPPIVDRENARRDERGKTGYEERISFLADRVRVRLGQLPDRLGDADWLDGTFSAGDLLMVMVLRRLRGSGILEEYPKLAAYVARGEARPAYKRAFAAQWACFHRQSPTRLIKVRPGSSSEFSFSLSVLTLSSRPCVDCEHRAGDILCFCSEKEIDHVYHVLDLRKATQRTPSRDLLPAIGPETLRHAGIHETRCDCVDVYS
jgi:glutathione S-transferase